MPAVAMVTLLQWRCLMFDNARRSWAKARHVENVMRKRRRVCIWDPNLWKHVRLDG